MCVSFTLKVVGERNKLCELCSNSKSKSVLLITDDIPCCILHSKQVDSQKSSNFNLTCNI